MTSVLAGVLLACVLLSVRRRRRRAAVVPAVVEVDEGAARGWTRDPLSGTRSRQEF